MKGHTVLCIRGVHGICARDGCVLAGDDGKQTRNLAPNDAAIRDYAAGMVRQGREIFRFDTFGDEAFWGGSLHLHQTIAGSCEWGVGAGTQSTGGSLARIEGGCRGAAGAKW